MQRDLTRLTGRVHDLVVVGGGIHGACIAWDATQRGLRVALIERYDFGSATSASSLRIAHGGLRSLTRGNFGSMRQSNRERSALLRIAPALVEPLPVLVPTSGKGVTSRPALRAVLRLNDLLSSSRNRTLDSDHRLPDGRLLPLDQCRRQFAAFPPGATGGAQWWDGRLRQPERLTLAFVRAAAAQGAEVANYCQMDQLVVENGTAIGVRAMDVLGGDTIEIRGHRVIVAAGPWTPLLCGQASGVAPQAFALNIEVSGRLAEVAVGVRSPAGPADDPVMGGHRFMFLVPQEATTLLGTWYVPWQGQDADALVRRGAASLIKEFNAACPGLALAEPDLVRCQWGLVPLKGGREPGRSGALAVRARVIDHGFGFGPRHMLSVEGVKFTTARGIAESVVDGVVASLGRGKIACRSAETRIDRPEDADGGPIRAQIDRAIREEMAVRLSDVIFRRTSLGLQLPPTRGVVVDVARIVADALGWTPAREADEIADVVRRLHPFGSTLGPAG
ncbi:MAG TPA: FAD-dependent oxidoreductase [Gemmatimonadales bacterium]|jgi:glycerol-3-phosphate dehydrogenase|nr:FAD-dependent oxidoreductase [Gemmatimonadales bacterium]